jgi:drug/metabolite transporter (DMT)-like permease
LITLIGRKFSPTYPLGFGVALLAGCIDVTGTFLFVRASQMGRLDTAVILSSLYPALTVLLARMFLGEHFTRWKTVGMVAALLAVPLIASG